MATTPDMALTLLDEVIDVTGWLPNEDFPVYPTGTKPKRFLVCPDEPPHPLLIPRHTYLFKVAQGWRAPQMWSEAIAYQIGCAASVEVPRCFVATNAITGENGALVEFFLRYPNELSPLRLLHGADLLQASGFTAGAERPHNLATNIELCTARGIANPVQWWATTVAFDALIGNTDRHPENWGLLADASDAEQFAPRFDNGTSLGYLIRDDQIDHYAAQGALDHFIDHGLGHMGWNEANDHKTALLELCARACTLEGAGAAIGNVIHADLSGVGTAVEACTRLHIEPEFAPFRADLVLRIVERRQARLREVCGG
jgi:HipA-like protein